MSENLIIAGVCGSLRKQSYNLMALHECERLAPDRVRLDIVTLQGIEPFSEDSEAEGFPPHVAALRERVGASDAVLFATPEYNYSISGVLKNAIDWLSRPDGSSPLTGKPAAIMGASTSRIGTARAQSHMRQIAYYNGMPLLSAVEVLIFSAQERFDADGRLTDPKTEEKLAQLMSEFSKWIRLNRAAG